MKADLLDHPSKQCIAGTLVVSQIVDFRAVGQIADGQSTVGRYMIQMDARCQAFQSRDAIELMVEVFGETTVMNDQRRGLMLTLVSDVSQCIPGNALVRCADAKPQGPLGRGMCLPPRSPGIARLKNRTEPTASHQDLIVPGIQAQQHCRDARWLLNPARTVILRAPNQVSGFSDDPHPIGPPLHLDKIHQWGVLLGNRQIDALPSQAIDRVPELG